MDVAAIAVDLVPVVADALERVARIAVFIAVGVFLANLAVSFGVVERVAVLSRYLTGPANLPDEVGTAILTTAASTTAGYGMLAEFREDGRLSDAATLVAVTINTFFGFVQHVFTYYVPVLIPILGARVGVMYVGARAAIALAITLTGVVAGAVLLSPEHAADGDAAGADAAAADDSAAGSGADDAADGDVEADADGPETTRERVRDAAASTWGKLTRIVPRLAVVYTLVTLLVANVDLRALSAAAGPLAEVAGLPAAALPVIVVFAFDTTAGAATVAPLVGDALTPKQAVATMLIGGIVSFAVSTFKRSIPFQYGIWGPEFGSKVVAVNTALKVVFIAVAVSAFLV
ncbi:nucleoside recognition protein [Halobaculum sp. D14]|uniref:nucleoside recognition protein n=1 Tax=Halobaculum sp. D14 TaxID=3421642 RepID=UPI003EBBB7EA